MHNRQIMVLSTITAAMLLLVATLAIANPTWAVPGTTPGPGAGTITLAGQMVVPAGSLTTGTASGMAWPVSGGEAVVAPISIPPAVTGAVGWGPSPLTSLTSGVPYFVVVRLDVTTGGIPETYYTEPKTILVP
jgi:hypothetical protein